MEKVKVSERMVKTKETRDIGKPDHKRVLPENAKEYVTQFFHTDDI